MKEKDKFIQIWEKKYKRIPPVNYVLRTVLREKWLRIYSLPDGKRYADNIEEKNEIYNRHSEVLKCMFNPDDEIYLIYLVYNKDIMYNECPFFKDFHFKNYNEWFYENIDLSNELHEDLDGAHLFVAKVKWELEYFKKILEAISDDILDPLIFFNSNEKIYCPYDGGADFIFLNKDEKDSFKTKFYEIISNREDGL